jgi:hypothetical protein
VYPFSLARVQEAFESLVNAKKTIGEAHDALTDKTNSIGGTLTLNPEERPYAYSGKLQNPDFEKGLSSWSSGGDGRAITGFGGYRSRPPGSQMAIVSTGLGLTTNVGGIWQKFCLPKEATKVEFDWAFSSEEFVEYCGRQFQDTFKVEFVTELDETKQVFSRTIDDLCSGVSVGLAPPLDRSGAGCEPTSNVGYGTGGNDCKVHTTGWQSASLGITDIATANDGGGIILKFSVTDIGDSSYDSAVILDNVKIVTPGP